MLQCSRAHQLLHQRQRKNLNPAFAFRHIKELYPIFWSKSSELVHALILNSEAVDPAGEKSSAPIDVNEWASRATLDIIGIAGLGQDFHSIRDPTTELIRTYKKIFSLGPRARLIRLLSFLLPTWLMRNLP
jgi:cytochrome P450